jgi:hypothetical protein
MFTPREQKGMIKPKKETHYGRQVWVSPEIEKLRHEHCLCWNCEKLKPGSDENCRIAATLYAVCRLTDVATPVTRCPEFVQHNAAR